MELKHNLHAAFPEMMQRFKSFQEGAQGLKINGKSYYVAAVNTARGSESATLFHKGKTIFLDANNLYTRWTVVGGVLHYIQHTNKGLNGSLTLICAE